MGIVADLFKWIFTSIGNVWTLTLFSVDQRPITVANVSIGIFLIVMGYWISKRFTRIASSRILPKFEIPVAQRAILESVIFYTLLTTTTFFALNMANVPLGTFTFLGGAVAIGVGFGSQNVVNNFMSGLILMIEQPVKVGDIIELDGLRGMIEHIGARSTRIRSYKNTHIIVPNSSFLQNNVINWTLASDMVLINVSVGVAYGSDTQLVKNLLEKSVLDEPKTLREPPPIVLFEEFGNDALNFNVYFAVKLVNHMERRRVESGIRFRIDQHFKANNICIAFPQRDVHLDSVGPIEVRVTKGAST